MREGRGRLVWSSGPGSGSSRSESRPCGRCGEDPCACEPVSSRLPREHDLRVRRERSGRRGKTVTVAGPFFLIRSDAAGLLKRMKKSCGGGGTLVSVRASTGEAAFMLEIQGDHVERLIDQFDTLGYSAKRSGG